MMLVLWVAIKKRLDYDVCYRPEADIGEVMNARWCMVLGQFLTAVACLTLSGCTAMKRQVLPYDRDPSLACIRAISDYPIMAPVIGRAIIQDEPPTLAQLSDQTKATDADKLALEFWATYRGNCITQSRSFRAQHSPDGYSEAIERHHARTLRAIGDVSDGRITWGQFARWRVDLHEEWMRDLKAVEQRQLGLTSPSTGP